MKTFRCIHIYFFKFLAIHNRVLAQMFTHEVKERLIKLNFQHVAAWILKFSDSRTAEIMSVHQFRAKMYRQLLKMFSIRSLRQEEGLQNRCDETCEVESDKEGESLSLIIDQVYSQGGFSGVKDILNFAASDFKRL